MENNWRNKSIEALEKRSYGDPVTAPTAITRRCLEYVKLPVGELTIEQLRSLISQQIGLTNLIPLALDLLAQDILAEGDYYPGDLLESVVSIDVEFWKDQPGLYVRSQEIFKKGEQLIRHHGLKIAFPELNNPIIAYSPAEGNAHLPGIS